MARTPEEIDEILSSCLESIQRGEDTVETILERYPDLEDVLLPQLEAALWLLSMKHEFDPRPEFVAASRRRIVKKARQVNGAKNLEPRLSRWELLKDSLLRKPMVQFATVLALIFIAFLVYSGNTLAAATNQSIPGDTLYPLRIASENVQLAFTSSDKRDIELHTQFAQRRLAEIQMILFEGRYEYVPATVSNYEYQVNEAVKQLKVVSNKNPESAKALSANLENVLSDQTQVLSFLAQAAPDQTEKELSRALQVSQSSLQEVQALPSGPGSISMLPSPSLTPTPIPSATSQFAPSATPPEIPTSAPSEPPGLFGLPTGIVTQKPFGIPTLTSSPTPSKAATAGSIFQPTSTSKTTYTYPQTPTSPPTRTPAPTATNTPITPSATETSLPSSTPVPFATATGTSVPVETTTAIPSWTPSSTPSPVPSLTPTETFTPAPTATPFPTATSPFPTETPTPVPTVPLPTLTSIPIPTSPSACVVSGSFHEVTGNKVEFNIKNQGAGPITILTIHLEWPATDEELKAVTVGENQIWSKTDDAPPTDITENEWIGDASLRQILPGTNKIITFVFKRSAEDMGYQTTINFGNECFISSSR